MPKSMGGKMSAFDLGIDYNFWRSLNFPDVLVLGESGKITRLLYEKPALPRIA